MDRSSRPVEGGQKESVVLKGALGGLCMRVHSLVAGLRLSSSVIYPADGGLLSREGSKPHTPRRNSYVVNAIAIDGTTFRKHGTIP